MTQEFKPDGGFFSTNPSCDVEIKTQDYASECMALLAKGLESFMNDSKNSAQSKEQMACTWHCISAYVVSNFHKHEINLPLSAYRNKIINGII